MFRTIGTIALMALAVPAMGEGLNYNYIEGFYERVNLDSGFVDEDGDGYGVAGSVALGDSWQLIASYGVVGFDFDVDLDQTMVGGGFHTSMTPNIDFVANLSYIRLEASSMGFSVDDDGVGASIGLRAMVSDSVELAGTVQYVELSTSGNDTSVRGELCYYFTPSFAVGLNAGTAEDVVRYGLVARGFFGS